MDIGNSNKSKKMSPEENPILSPYAYQLDSTDSEIHSERDCQTIISFIPNEYNFGKVLDIGEINYVSKKLSQHYNIEIDQTNIDLDVGTLEGQYDTIFCFEVIEHLFNPLHLLLQMKNILKPNGNIFLSTPKRRPHFMWYKYHFHEFSKTELNNLFLRADMKIIKKEYKMTGRPIINYFKGVRPLLRLFIERKCLVQLSKV